MSDKEYKYPVKLDDDMVLVGRVYSDAGRQNQSVIRKGRKAIWKPNLGLRKKDFRFTKVSAAMYGEFIANLIYKKIGIPSSDVEMLKRNLRIPRSASGKTAEVPGCISYYSLEPDEDLVQAINILAWYKDKHYDEYLRIMDPLGALNPNDYTLNINNEENNNNVELIIPAFEAYVRELANAPEDQIQMLRQALIDMIVFDCRFANTDRNDENYGLAISPSGFRLYPLFDNEYILGFPEFVEDIQKFSGARLQEHIDRDLTSRMGISSQVKKLGYQAMLTYLFTTYPEETKLAYERVMQFSDQDLLGIMEECEGLDEIHKDYAHRIFKSRQRGFKYVKEEYIDENGDFIPQVLPGNKPMEIIKKKPTSKSPHTMEEKANETR